MNTYFSFACAGDEKPGVNAFTDGESLAERCFNQIQAFGGPSRFPPQLLILLASSKYLENGRAHDLVPGIVTYFNKNSDRRVPLIGSSVAAVLFHGKVHECGAVLICLASKPEHFHARVGAAGELTEKLEDSIASLAGDLTIRPEDNNPDGKAKLLLFLPSQLPGCFPSDLYKCLSEKTGYRLIVTGGVSYPIAVQDPGLQFTEFGVQSGAIVAARLDFHVQVASGLGRSLSTTEKYATVKNSAGKPQIVTESGLTEEELIREKGFALLGRTVEDRSSAEIVINRADNGFMTRELGKVRDGEQLEILVADRKRIQQQAEYTLTEPMRRIQMINPVGSIAFQCASCYRFRKNIGLDLEAQLAGMGKALNQAPVVGGFFAGEIGVDFAGHSMLANFAGATLTFGDERQERFIRQGGFKAIAGASRKLGNAQSIADVIKESLDMIDDAGYAGSMVSMLQPDGGKEWIVTKRAGGERFEEAARALESKAKMKPLAEDEVLAAIANEGKPRYISGSQPRHEAWGRQYIIPLSGYTGRRTSSSTASEGKEIFGFLHIDLGEGKNDEPHDAEKQVLNSLGAAVESALTRAVIEEEATIMRKLDQAMGDALMQSSVDAGRRLLLNAVVDALGAYTGYIRRRNGNSLEIAAESRPGRNCELIREHLPKIDVINNFLPARAFASDKTMVSNDVFNDGTYQRVYDQNPMIRAYLDQGGSYAAAVLRNASGEKLGTIVIQAQQPWSFCRHHLRCLETFCRRLPVAVDHLEKTLPANFLLKIGEDLPAAAHSPSLDDALKTVVQNFLKACSPEAEVVSLFLWEPSFERFLLHAEAGWKNRGWELSAYYAEHEGWTGSVALEGEPRYVPDLRKIKRNIGNEHDAGRYQLAMFWDRDDSKNTEVRDDLKATESVGLPLKAGGKRLGVLIALRRHNAEENHDPFVPTDSKVLVQAGDRIGGYVSALLLQRSDRLEREKDERYRAINRAISAGEESESGPESALCQQLLRQYKPEQVFFYSNKLKCVASEPAAEETPDEVVQRVSRNLEPDFGTIEPKDDEERNDRDRAASHGLLQRACIPLAIKNLLVGIIDMRWPKGVKRSQHVLRHGYDKELKAVGAMIASVYQRYLDRVELKQTKTKAESVATHSEQRAEAMVAPAKQALHRCKNIDALLAGLERAMLAGDNRDELVTRIQEIRSKTHQLPRAMKFLKTGVEAPQTDVRVEALLEEAAAECDWSKDIRCIQSFTAGLLVHANPEWLREAFFNIIDNGVRAMRDKAEPGTLTISTIVTSDQKVRIIFKDTGVGMTGEEIETVFRGSAEEKLHRTGVGVPLTKVLLAEQGGVLKIESEKGFGTEVTVELPLKGRIEHGISGTIDTGFSSSFDRGRQSNPAARLS